MDVGIKLKKLRELHGVSQRALARKTGVSNAMISMIESGRTDPTLGNLKAILDGFPISIGEFLSMDVAESKKVFFAADELSEIGGKNISYRQVGSDLSEHQLQINHECYQPGSDTGRSRLKHVGEEGGVIISGRLEITVGDETRVLGPGDAYLFNSEIPHRFRNPGKEACIVVSACTPPNF